MKNIRYRFLIYFLLLAFSGQVAALPLLSCCNEIDQGAESNSVEHDHSMSMHHHMDSDINSKMDSTVDSTVDSTMENETQMLTDSINQDCNNQCGFCITTSAVMSDTDASPKSIQNYQHNSAYNLILTSSTSDNPFRPPITA